MPLQLVQQATTSSELLEWEQYLDERDKESHREDYFLAQIALEIRRSWVTEKNGPTLAQFMINEKFGAAPPAAVPITDETDDDKPEIDSDDLPPAVQASMAVSKSFWGALTAVAAPPKCPPPPPASAPS